MWRENSVDLSLYPARLTIAHDTPLLTFGQSQDTAVPRLCRLLATEHWLDRNPVQKHHWGAARPREHEVPNPSQGVFVEKASNTAKVLPPFDSLHAEGLRPRFEPYFFQPSMQNTLAKVAFKSHTANCPHLNALSGIGQQLFQCSRQSLDIAGRN